MKAVNPELERYAGLVQQLKEKSKERKALLAEKKERSAVDKVKAAYGENYDPMMMHGSKRDVANLLHEEAETRSVREFLHQKQKTHMTQQQRNPKRHAQER